MRRKSGDIKKKARSFGSCGCLLETTMEEKSPPPSSESVLQKFRKTLSLRFQGNTSGPTTRSSSKRGSKDSCSDAAASDGGGGADLGGIRCGAPSEDDSSPVHVPSIAASTGHLVDDGEEHPEHKYKFGPLIWRSSKERKKLNKAARNAKCNSGDSGIQIEMAPTIGVSSGGGCGGDSSESPGGAGSAAGGDETDPPEESSPPAVRRRRRQHHHNSNSHGTTGSGGTTTTRPHSDLFNQILIDKFKADLKQRASATTTTSDGRSAVRRTRSDLGGRRLLGWAGRTSEHRAPYRRVMSDESAGGGGERAEPAVTEGVTLRAPPPVGTQRRGRLRRSLSQPVDIDKLSPLMRSRMMGIRHGPTAASDSDADTPARHHPASVTSDEDTMSDSESSSVTSLTDRRKASLEAASTMDEQHAVLAEAVFDHVAIEPEELAFRAGDVVEVLETAHRDWWWGEANGRVGWFPAQFVRLRVSQEDTVEDHLAALASGAATHAATQLRRRTSVTLLSNEQVRARVVRELVQTERDFVKVLRDVAEGYVAECRKRKDMFTEEQIEMIFINLEDILRFQTEFLHDLEASINWEAPHKSCVGDCFLKHRSGFKMYSDYCNSHPMATASLQELYQYNNYSKFFEACRLMRGLIEIPLDGYLLTPVQRICKYPLQLAELLKYTRPDHDDYENIKEALDVMRGVAVLINERKRRMESLEKLAGWQLRVEGWEGEDLIEQSSQLIHQGEVVRVTTGMWTSNITLFLFDHQIVYCKKDILKRNTYVYKGRIYLDMCEVTDVPDGKDLHLGVTVRHAVRLRTDDRWLLFCCRSSSEKRAWLAAFAEERRQVTRDHDDGLELPPAARQLATVAARCQRRPPRKLRNGKGYKRDTGYMGSTFHLNSPSHCSSYYSLGRKMGTWFTFGANKKVRHHRHHQDVS